MSQAQPRIVVEYDDNIAIVTFTDKRILEEVDMKSIEESLLPLVRQSDYRNFVLDFKNVQFLSSSALGLLIRISKAVYDRDGRIRLCSINEKIYDIFRITRLNKVFDIWANREEAINSFGDA